MNGEKLVIDVWVPSVIMIRITIIPSFSRRFDIQNVSDDARRKGAHCTVGLKWEKEFGGIVRIQNANGNFKHKNGF